MKDRLLGPNSRFIRVAMIIDGLFRWKPKWLRPGIMLPLLAVVFLVYATLLLRHTVTERIEHSRPVAVEKESVEKSFESEKQGKGTADLDIKDHYPHLYRMLYSGDSQAYLGISHIFAQGDCSCSYVALRPHRQPLYPLLLAIPQRIVGDAPFWLGFINVLAGIGILLLLYRSSLMFHRNWFIAACAAAFFFSNRFLVDEITGRIMTEPVFILFCVAAIHFFLRYGQNRQRRMLVFAAGFLALCYLTRPNGLFLMGSMMGSVYLAETLFPRTGEQSRIRTFRRTTADFAIALSVFIIIAIPSWLPRLYYLDSPLAHGYLGNFMWVDSYQQGHTGLPYQSFHLADYIGNHSFGDVLSRWAYGLSRVFWDIPVKEESVPVLYIVAVFGMITAIIRRNRAYCQLGVFFMVQMLPLVWTTLSNPNHRVPYSAMLPFEFFFAVFFLRTLASWAARVKVRRTSDSESFRIKPKDQPLHSAFAGR